MDRIADLISYSILDTDPEVEMDEIAQMAKAIFNTPTSIVSFMDDDRQWCKAKIGVSWSEVPLEDTFCRFTLDKPDEILLILDPLKDSRVSDNPYVVGEEGIRFYVSAPIISPHGNVLGTVCTWDSKMHEVQHAQLEALKLLARRVSISLETRKILKDQNRKIELYGDKLRRLTELSPGAFFRLVTDPWTKEAFLDFLSGGITRLLPGTSVESLEKNPTQFIDWISPKFRFKLLKEFVKATKCRCTFEMDVPVIGPDGKKTWLWVKARPEFEDGKINFYGTIQDISQKIAHIKSLRKFLFDISHKLRAPVAKLKAVLNVIEDENDPELTKEMTPYLSHSAEELDDCIFRLNDEYSDLVKLMLEEN